MKPTKKQKLLLDFIDGFVKGRGYSPTLREIMQALGYKSVSTVAKHVDNLIVRGWLIKRDGEARSLEVVSPENDVLSQDERIYEAWLQNRVKRVLSNTDITEADKEVIARSMELLGMSMSSSSSAN